MMLREVGHRHTFEGLAYVHGLINGALIEEMQGEGPLLQEFALR